MAEIETFDGENFGFWKMQMEEYLHERLHIELNGKKPESMSKADWERLDRQVLSIIRSTLSKSVANKVFKQKTSAGLIAALSMIYDKPSSDKPREVKEHGFVKKDVIAVGLFLPVMWSISYMFFKLAGNIPPYDYKA